MTRLEKILDKIFDKKIFAMDIVFHLFLEECTSLEDVRTFMNIRMVNRTLHHILHDNIIKSHLCNIVRKIQREVHGTSNIKNDVNQLDLWDLQYFLQRMDSLGTRCGALLKYDECIISGDFCTDFFLYLQTLHCRDRWCCDKIDVYTISSNQVALLDHIKSTISGMKDGDFQVASMRMNETRHDTLEWLKKYQSTLQHIFDTKLYKKNMYHHHYLTWLQASETIKNDLMNLDFFPKQAVLREMIRESEEAEEDMVMFGVQFLESKSSIIYKNEESQILEKKEISHTFKLKYIMNFADQAFCNRQCFAENITFLFDMSQCCASIVGYRGTFFPEFYMSASTRSLIYQRRIHFNNPFQYMNRKMIDKKYDLDHQLRRVVYYLHKGFKLL